MRRRPPSTRFLVVLESTTGDETARIHGLRRILKNLLRVGHFRCTEARQLDRDDRTRATHQVNPRIQTRSET
jgi:hypothetical protein